MLLKIKYQIDRLLSEVKEAGDGTVVRDVFNPSIKQDIKKYPQVDNILNGANEIWLGSDWHLWKKGSFQNLDRGELIKNQVRTVKPNDAYIFLGDIAHRDTFEKNLKDKLYKLLNVLRGKKILVLGNHDIFEKEFYYDCGFEHVNEGFIWQNYVFSHVPLHFSAFKGAEYNIHGHTHGYNGDRKVPYKNHVCIYSKNYNNMPITLEQSIIRFERYKRGQTIPEV